MYRSRLKSPFKDPSKLQNSDKQAVINAIEWLFDDSDSFALSDRLIARNGPYKHKEPRLRTLCHLGIMLNYVIKYFLFFEIFYKIDKLKDRQRICEDLIKEDISQRPINSVKKQV